MGLACTTPLFRHVLADAARAGIDALGASYARAEQVALCAQRVERRALFLSVAVQSRFALDRVACCADVLELVDDADASKAKRAGHAFVIVTACAAERDALLAYTRAVLFEETVVGCAFDIESACSAIRGLALENCLANGRAVDEIEFIAVFDGKCQARRSSGPVIDQLCRCNERCQAGESARVGRGSRGHTTSLGGERHFVGRRARREVGAADCGGGRRSKLRERNRRRGRHICSIRVGGCVLGLCAAVA